MNIVAIGAMEPRTACPGSRITLTPPDGHPFPPQQGHYQVFFQARCAFVAGTVRGWSAARIAVDLPEDAVSGSVVITAADAMTGSVGAGGAGVKSCLNAAAEIDRQLFGDAAIAWPPRRIPIGDPIPWFTRPGSSAIAIPMGMTATPRSPGLESSLRQACGALHCSFPMPGLIGPMLTIVRKPELGNLFVTPGFKKSAGEYGATERDVGMTWSLRGVADKQRLTNLDTHATTDLSPTAGQHSLTVNTIAHLRLEASNTCGADLEEIALIPAYRATWETDSATVQPHTPQRVRLRLSRPALTPVTLALNGTRVRLPSASVTIAAGASEAIVDYELDSTFEPGSIEIAPPAGLLLEPLPLFLVLAIAPPADTATGIVEYEDCSPDNKFNAVTGAFESYAFSCAGAPFLPARSVEVWFSIPLRSGWTFYVKGTTDDSGRFAVPIPNLSNGTGQLGSTVQIHIPTRSALFTGTANVFFEGAVQASYFTGLPRGNALHNLRLRIRGEDAAPFNAYDNIIASQRYLSATMGWTAEATAQNLRRFVVSLDGSWCVGAAVHTQQIPSNTMMCIGDPVEIRTANKLATTLFDDETVRHEYGHHLQNMMGQWQPIPRYHNGCWVSLQAWDLEGKSMNTACGVADTGFDGSRWSNSEGYAWFEGFPSYFADRVAASQGLAMGRRWCRNVGGTFCTASNVCDCMAVGHKTTGLLHTITSSEIEDFVVSVLHEAIGQSTLTDRDVMTALWNGLRGAFPGIHAVRDRMQQAGANVVDLDRFMQAYRM